MCGLIACVLLPAPVVGGIGDVCAAVVQDVRDEEQSGRLHGDWRLQDTEGLANALDNLT